ncbi:MAG: amidohydrolase family protein [Planctomycetota bacterium]|nr:amidohydrolase family protein [Planctomycetota bacterium]
MNAMGLREAHAHIPMLGLALRTLDLSDCVSREECLERLRERADALSADDPAGKRWLAARGARVSAWRDARWPTRDEIDAIASGRPAYVMSFDHHALVAGSAAFRAAGIADADPDPPGGVVERARDGTPTGLLLESAAWKVRVAEPEPQGEERARVVLDALAHLRALGFSEVHDLLSPAWLGPELSRMASAGELPVLVKLYPALEVFDEVLAGAGAWQRDDVVLAGAKVFVDGTLNARTAWMLEPYADPMPERPTGMALLTPAQLDGAIARTRAARLGLAAHAIGDGAVRAVLDAWERAGPGKHVWIRPGTPALRIEHAELVHPADVGRFAGLGVVCSVQPCHLLTDIEVLERQLADRLERVLPLRDLMASGCRPGELLWFGSDVPIVRANPEDSVRAAVDRGRAGMARERRIAPRQAISEADAWRCFERTPPT